MPTIGRTERRDSDMPATRPCDWKPLLMPSTVLIVPAFNDRPSCARLLREISSLSGAHDWRICLVDDGSTTDAPQLSDLSDLCLRGTILRLTRNVGHQAAIACGVGYVAEIWPGVSALIMDADGLRHWKAPSLMASLAPFRTLRQGTNARIS